MDTQYKWMVDGVEHTLKHVVKKGEYKWMVWREWKDERNFPQIGVEWFDTQDEAFEKYPGSLIQASLGI